MKTIIKNGVYERVSNEVGENKVDHGGYKYVKKEEWKKNVRDIKKPEPVEAKKSEVPEIKKPYQKPRRS